MSTRSWQDLRIIKFLPIICQPVVIFIRNILQIFVSIFGILYDSLYEIKAVVRLHATNAVSLPLATWLVMYQSPNSGQSLWLRGQSRHFAWNLDVRSQ